MRKLLPVLALGVYFLVYVKADGEIERVLAHFVDKSSCERASSKTFFVGTPSFSRARFSATGTRCVPAW